jgi:hypothetical protein
MKSCSSPFLTGKINVKAALVISDRDMSLCLLSARLPGSTTDAGLQHQFMLARFRDSNCCYGDRARDKQAPTTYWFLCFRMSSETFFIKLVTSA